MRDPDAILLPGENRKALLELYLEVLGYVWTLPGNPSPMEELAARSITADLWVTARHVAPVAAHDEARIQRTQASARQHAAAEVGERAAIRAACWASAAGTLKTFRALQDSLRGVVRQPAEQQHAPLRVVK
jgi:hypothetical protein